MPIRPAVPDLARGEPPAREVYRCGSTPGTAHPSNCQADPLRADRSRCPAFPECFLLPSLPPWRLRGASRGILLAGRLLRDLLLLLLGLLAFYCGHANLMRGLVHIGTGSFKGG